MSWRWSMGFLLNGWLCAHSTLFSFDLFCQSIHLQSNFWVDLHVKPRESYSVLGVHPAGVKTVLSFCFCCKYKEKGSFSLAFPVNIIPRCKWFNCLTTSDSLVPHFFCIDDANSSNKASFFVNIVLQVEPSTFQGIQD